MRTLSRLYFGLALVSLLTRIPAPAQSGSTAYDLVDPLIGSDGGGNTFPGASMPFGMMQWSPDTNRNARYFYNEKQIDGFSLTHLSGAGCALYGDFGVLPMTGVLTESPGAKFDPYAAPFDHGKEEAHAGYYTVTLANGIRVEITVAERSGIARFIFPAGASSRLLVNAGSSADSLAADPAPWSGHYAFGNRIHLKSPDSFDGSVTAGGFCSTESQYRATAGALRPQA
jgi:putative alpha-1,2-mannosidase